jgi:putative DNA primase/helicase
LICNYCAVIITGHEAGAVLASDDPVETDKTLAAKLIAGHSIVLLDNVTHALHSALLAQITSEPIVEPRILGHSRTVAIQNTVLVLINGNNLALLGDLPRRALKCRLDAKVDRPELRVFHSENPLPYAKRNRPELVAAALTILLAYRVAGSPDMGVPALGTFEQWSTRVRNALLWLDQADPIETQKDIREVDRSLNSHMILLEQWFEAAVTVSNPNATSGLSAKRLIEIANEQSFGDVATRRYPELFDALYDIAGARDRVDATKLGNYLNRKVDQMVGRMRLERAGKEHSAMLWRVVRMP